MTHKTRNRLVIGILFSAILLIGVACQAGSDAASNRDDCVESCATVTVQQSITVPTDTPEAESERVGETRVTPTAAEVVVTPDAVTPTATTTLTVTTEMTGAVACPFGKVNDPYPGNCGRYVDANENGICDLSEPGSGG
ncbi:MAG: hypothetical protein KAX24_08715 [Anaerolineae bacterium]|nr:hypothetical protein [Anaerolineae bacterium]